ncbi:hypothetical protein [Pararhodobacter sp.]|uniref:hypothetical protein n=1 Tax=Pararhodobacter sp. TaxID=2127056 RepID=UPI002AFF86EE|nr:hypothetical protein [Pararhodobacter sp.]
MTNPKPVGPYQTLREAICAGLDAGQPVRVVAASLNEALGRPATDRRLLNYASGIKHRGGRAGPVSVSLTLPAKIFGGLTVRAVDRGLTPAALATRLIEIAVRDDMIDAILDDGGEA